MEVILCHSPRTTQLRVMYGFRKLRFVAVSQYFSALYPGDVIVLFSALKDLVKNLSLAGNNSIYCRLEEAQSKAHCRKSHTALR